MEFHVFTIAPVKLTLYLKVKDFFFLRTFKLEVVILKLVANLLLKSKVEAVGTFWSTRLEGQEKNFMKLSFYLSTVPSDALESKQKKMIFKSTSLNVKQMD